MRPVSGWQHRGYLTKVNETNKRGWIVLVKRARVYGCKITTILYQRATEN